MTISPDYLIDRNKLKRQVANWKLITFVTLILLCVVFFSSNQSNLGKKVPVITPPHIARISMEGILYYDREKLDSLKEIGDNNAIKAIIMHVNSPGGTTVGGESLYWAVKKINEKKPVVVVMDDVAASAGYMVALGGDYLIGYNTTLTGSIGALMMAYEVTELAKKVGVKFNNIKSSKLKGGPLPTEELTEEMKNALQSNVDSDYHTFINIVAERRKIALEQLYAIADGRVYTGKQALENKLIDAIGDEDLAIKWLHEAKGISDIPILDIHLVKKESKLFKLLDSMDSLASTINTLIKSNSFNFF